MTLQVRLALVMSLIVTVAIGMTGMLNYLSLKVNLLAGLDDTLSLRANSLVHRLSPLVRQGSIDKAELEGISLNPQPLGTSGGAEIFAQVFDRNGTPLASSANLMGGNLPLLHREGGPLYETVNLESGAELRLLTVPLTPSGGGPILVLGESTALMSRVLDRSIQRTLTVMTLTLIVTLLVLLTVLNRGLDPLTRVARAANAIVATGNMQLRTPVVNQRDEVGHVALAFNTVVQRVDELVGAQRRLLADTSHELRNPLTVLRTNLDLLKQDVDAETRQEVVLESEREVVRMARLVDELLLLSLLETHPRSQFEPLQLDQLALETVRQMEALHGRELALKLPDAPIEVQGDADRIKQILTNLIENAMRYTPPPGRIEIRVRRDAGATALVEVEDEGCGIAPEHQARIFDRFYRVDPARSRASGGTGLGLSICRALAEAHGGSLELRSTPGRGTTFTLSLTAL